MEEPLIGTPRKHVSEWLEEYARDNSEEVRYAFWPWEKWRLRARARAFKEAADMVRRAHSDNERDKCLPFRLDPNQSVTFPVSIVTVKT